MFQGRSYLEPRPEINHGSFAIAHGKSKDDSSFSLFEIKATIMSKYYVSIFFSRIPPNRNAT